MSAGLGEIRKDQDEEMIQLMLKQHPQLDWLICKSLINCYKAGTLDKIIEDREKIDYDKEKDRPDNLVIKDAFTIE